MNPGWVPFSREWMSLIKNHSAWILWSWLYLRAQYKEYQVIVGGKLVNLHPGQLIFTLRNAAKETGLSMRETRTALTTLKNIEFLTHEPTRTFSIVTLTKWDSYEGRKEGADTPNDTAPTQHRHINNKETKKPIFVVHHGTERVSVQDGIKEVLSLLNEKRSEIVGNGIRPITAVGELKERLRDHSVVEVCRVILTKADDPHFRENLRFFHPNTLFKKSKFEKYLDEVELFRATRSKGDA